MKLSILDQIPISEGETPQTALQQTLQLAKKQNNWGIIGIGLQSIMTWLAFPVLRQISC